MRQPRLSIGRRVQSVCGFLLIIRSSVHGQPGRNSSFRLPAPSRPGRPAGRLCSGGAEPLSSPAPPRGSGLRATPPFREALQTHAAARAPRTHRGRPPSPPARLPASAESRPPCGRHLGQRESGGPGPAPTKCVTPETNVPQPSHVCSRP